MLGGSGLTSAALEVTYRVTWKPQTGWKGPHPDLGAPGNVRSEPLRVDRLRALMPEQQAKTLVLHSEGAMGR